MKLRVVVDSVLKNQDEIVDYQRNLRDSFGINNKVLELLINNKSDCYYNITLINILCDALQLVNDNDKLAEFSLDDVERMYGKNIALNPYDVSFYEDMHSLNSMFLAKRAFEIIEEKKRYLKTCW